MITAVQVDQEVDWLTVLLEIVGAYEEIAAAKMQKIRRRVLANRDFLAELRKVYTQVQFSYQQEVGRRQIEEGVKKNGKTALVFLSANTGLYGSIIEKTFALFFQEVKTAEADLFIVGKLGKTLFQARSAGRAFTYYDFPDTAIEYQGVRKLVDALMGYSRVIIYHGVYRTAVTQDAVGSSVTGGSDLTAEKTSTVGEKWIYEPSVTEILVFFETEIFASLVVQTIHESMLAKLSSRLVTLDEAQERVKDALRRSVLTASRLKHRTRNKKQLGSFSGMSLWRST